MNFAKHLGHRGTFRALLLFRNLRKETRNAATNSHHLGFLLVNTLTLNKYQLMLTSAKNSGVSAQNTMSLGKWLLELCILTLQFNTQYVPTSSKPYEKRMTPNSRYCKILINIYCSRCFDCFCHLHILKTQEKKIYFGLY